MNKEPVFSTDVTIAFLVFLICILISLYFHADPVSIGFAGGG
jgi:hypothetical protein